MKVNPFPNPIPKKILHIRTDYSQISSRLFSSHSKSKQKPYHAKQQILPKTIKKSIEKVEEIGEQNYKDAMRHVEKFKKYEEEVKRKKLQQQIDSECTFKPKFINNKKYNPEATFMNISFTQRCLKKSKEFNPQKIILKEKSFTSKKNENNKKQQEKPKKRILGQKLAQRLMNWGKDRDSKIVTKQVQAQVSKSISRKSSIESQQQGKFAILKQKSYRQLHEKKLNLTTSNIMNGTKKKLLSSSNVKGYEESITPQKSARTHKQMARSTISLKSVKSFNPTKRKELLDGLLEEFKFNNIEEQQVSKEQQTFMKKRLKFYTEISPSVSTYQTAGEKILSNQSQRGEGQFYIRQAKANISKNYQKTEVLVKNNNYRKKFSTNYVHAIVLRDKNSRK